MGILFMWVNTSKGKSMSLSYSEFQMVQQDLNTMRSREASLQIAVIKAQNERDAALAVGDTAAADAASARAESRTAQLNETQAEIGQLQSQVDSFYNTPTVKSESDASRQQQYENPGVVDGTDPNVPGSSGVKRVTLPGDREVPGVPKGAEKQLAPKPSVVFTDITGSKLGEDLRVKLRVPQKYLTAATIGPNGELDKLGGIVFPYTPTINFDLKADYSSTNPVHSNFSINFYKGSSVGSISIAGKFSVENKKDAYVYIATTHLLKALTRMRFGGTSGDADSGAPPPVCRLDAHGEMMLTNVPVAITSFRVDLPDSVDYFTLADSDFYGPTSVPTVSTISITCLPMYSREEMQKFSVTGYITGNSYKLKGFI